LFSCIIREQDRVVGETTIPNLGAKDKYEFSIGEDADIIYKENVTMISLTTFNETRATEEQTSPTIIVTLKRFVYQIHVQLTNFKNRPVNIEYEQKGFHAFHTLQLKKSQNDLFIHDGSSIKSKMTLKANTAESYSYTIELVR
jgi:hypothetical protein